MFFAASATPKSKVYDPYGTSTPVGFSSGGFAWTPFFPLVPSYMFFDLWCQCVVHFDKLCLYALIYDNVVLCYV